MTQPTWQRTRPPTTATVVWSGRSCSQVEGRSEGQYMVPTSSQRGRTWRFWTCRSSTHSRGIRCRCGSSRERPGGRWGALMHSVDRVGNSRDGPTTLSCCLAERSVGPFDMLGMYCDNPNDRHADVLFKWIPAKYPIADGWHHACMHAPRNDPRQRQGILFR